MGWNISAQLAYGPQELKICGYIERAPPHMSVKYKLHTPRIWQCVANITLSKSEYEFRQEHISH